MEKANFVCHNLHAKERVNENGVDIECKSESAKVVIQAKVRPQGKDVDQLRKFAKVNANRRLYVYWDAPTRGFVNELNLLQVEVLSGKKLHEFLIKNFSPGYLGWKILQSAFISNVVDSILMIYECQNNPHRGMVQADLPYLWRLKSGMVKVKTDARLIMHESSNILLSQHDDEGAVKSVDEIIQRFSHAAQDSESLRYTVERCKTEAPNVLRRLVAHLAGISKGEDLHAAISKRAREEQPPLIGDWLIEPIEVRQFTSVFTWLNHTLDILSDRFDLLSQVTDMVFKDALREVLGLEVAEHFD